MDFKLNFVQSPPKRTHSPKRSIGPSLYWGQQMAFETLEKAANAIKTTAFDRPTSGLDNPHAYRTQVGIYPQLPSQYRFVDSKSASIFRPFLQTFDQRQINITLKRKYRFSKKGQRASGNHDALANQSQTEFFTTKSQRLLSATNRNQKFVFPGETKQELVELIKYHKSPLRINTENKALQTLSTEEDTRFAEEEELLNPARFIKNKPGSRPGTARISKSNGSNVLTKNRQTSAFQRASLGEATGDMRLEQPEITARGSNIRVFNGANPFSFGSPRVNLANSSQPQTQSGVTASSGNRSQRIGINRPKSTQNRVLRPSTGRVSSVLRSKKEEAIRSVLDVEASKEYSPPYHTEGDIGKHDFFADQLKKAEGKLAQTNGILTTHPMRLPYDLRIKVTQI